MIWSKLKKTIQPLLAASVEEHLKVHFTRYGPGESYTMNRAWLAWDGEEISTFSTIRWINARNSLAAQLSGDNELRMHYECFAQAENLLARRGIYPAERFLAALEQYTSLSVENALCSSDALIRAWAMFDRRLGKRRLRAVRFDENASEFERLWYRLRCEADRLLQ